MKFTLSWLKNHLETDASVDDISRTLTAIGLEVEDVADNAAALKDFTVAEILETTQHPDADRLRVCRVNSDAGELQIVCGAPNARAGIKVALAKVGAVIPNGGFTIKQSKIRGIESCGMLCSADELGLGTDNGGIMELPESAVIGQPIAEVLGLNDVLIEINITPNRGDCLGVHGIARDLAAAGLGKLKALSLSREGKAYEAISSTGSPRSTRDSEECPISITLATPHCKQFVGCVVRGVKNGDSPEWLQQRLKAIGLRPISALVDITNFMAFAHARPLHVYDMKKLCGGITVREGLAGEQFLALNDKTYTLEGGECVITDESGVLGFGGVIGGASTGVDATTTDVLLECAWFEPEHIARIGRTHGVLSDARYRFERGVDHAFLEQGAAIAVNMIQELCGGTPSEFSVIGNVPDYKHEIAFDAAFTNQLSGVEIAENEQLRILESLGFEVIRHPASADKQGSGSFGDAAQAKASQHDIVVTPPSWRPDVHGKADVAEEVLRIFGFDNVPSVPMPKLAKVNESALDASQRLQSKARRTFASRGLMETHSFAFIEQRKAQWFGATEPLLKLVNPISADLDTMRPNLLPNLIDSALRNMARGTKSLGLFEVGAQYEGARPKQQRSMAAAIRIGNADDKQWNTPARAVDCFDAKADALALLALAGIDAEKVQVLSSASAWYHPGRSGTLCLGPKLVLAYFGELHPATLLSMDCKERVVACEVFLDALPIPKKKVAVALKSSDFQAVDRDFAFVTPETLASETLLKALRGADKSLVQQVKLFDVYQGKGVEDGFKSLAVTVKLQATDRTLKDDEIEAVAKKLLDAAHGVGAKLRA